MADTSIEWAEKSWNPTIGCSRVSAGCGDGTGGGCYAERMARRLELMGQENYKGLTRVTERGNVRWTGVVRTVPEKLAEPMRWKKPARIFVNSMSDLFHEDVPNEYIAAVFGVMAACPQHTFIVLTKRAARMEDWFWWAATHVVNANSFPLGLCVAMASQWIGRGSPEFMPHLLSEWPAWPLPNVWLLVSAENQETLDERVPHLLRTPAAVRGVSAEPLLEPLMFPPGTLGCPGHLAETFGNPLIHWVIVGGESGSGARPFDLTWGRGIVEQCKAAGVACFVKQMGSVAVSGSVGVQIPFETGVNVWGRPAAIAGGGAIPILVRLKAKKGGDPAEWPADLRVRQFPEVR